MAISARLSRSLRQSLGDEGADDLVNWMVQVESNRSELHSVMDAWRVTTDTRFSEFGARMDQRFAEHERSIDQRFAEHERSIDQRFAEHERSIDQRFAEHERSMDAQFAEMRLAFTGLETRFERRFGDLMKWSFVFWCGAIGAVAILARAIR